MDGKDMRGDYHFRKRHAQKSLKTFPVPGVLWQINSDTSKSPTTTIYNAHHQAIETPEPRDCSYTTDHWERAERVRRADHLRSSRAASHRRATFRAVISKTS